MIQRKHHIQAALLTELNNCQPRHASPTACDHDACCPAAALCNCLQRNNLSSCATATPLVWGEPLPQEVHPPYDLILCSDVVYNKDMVHQLLHTLKTLSGPDTVMYISSEFRENAGLEQFLELMRDQYQLYAQLVRGGLRVGLGGLGWGYSVLVC